MTMSRDLLSLRRNLIEYVRPGVGALALCWLVASAGGAAAQAGAQDLLRKGMEAQRKGQHEAAITLLSRAVSAGTLPRKQLAVALYRRAISLRKKKQPAQAISDLNSALFFKDDLTSRDRANAIELRMKAYKDAGLSAGSAPVARAAPRAAGTSDVASTTQSGGPRIVTTAPRRVAEPVRPRRTTSSLPLTAPILGGSSTGSLPASPTAGATAAAGSATYATAATRPPAAPTFQTRPAPTGYAPTTVTSRGTNSTAVYASRSAPVRRTAPTTNWGATTEHSAAVSQYRSPVPRTTAAVPAPRAVTSANQPAGFAPRTAYRPAAQPTAPQRVASVSRPAPAPKPAVPRTTSSIGSLFGGLFGGNSTAKPASSQRTAVARPAERQPTLRSSVQPATGTTRAPARGASVAPVTPRVAPVASPRPATPPQVERAPPPLRQAALPSVTSPVVRKRSARGYDIRLAKLRGQYRAEALAKQLEVEYSDQLRAGRTIRVEPGQDPELGPVYSVLLGSYPSRAAVDDMCGQLEAEDYECVAVAK